MSAPGVEELALRVVLGSFPGPALPADWARLLDEGLGGVCLFGSNLPGSTDDAAALVAAVRARRAAVLVATDEEGGDVTRLHRRDASPVPGPAVLGAVDDADLTRAVGVAVGAELAAVGIDLALGPVADVNSNPDNPVIGTRSFGARPDLVARHVAAWVAGLQSAGVAACVKHFPGHGDTAQDSHLTLPVLDADLATLEARELVPFAAAIDAGAAAVMTSHLVVPTVDPALPATLSRPVLALLRDGLGHDGVIVSDALDMAGASGGRSIPEAAVDALAAGVDLLCTGPDKEAALVRDIQSAIVEAVAGGRLPRARLAEAAARVDGLTDRLRKAATGAVAAAAAGLVDARRLAQAAREALLVEGPLPDLTGATVVSIAIEANIAVGEGRWGVDADLVVTEGDVLPDGPVVVQVRDGHRRPGVAAMLAALTGPALVVEWGWPGPRTGWEGARHARVCTRGNGRPSITAVEEILGEAGWQR
ncbi:MAG TPA: glycoside hydrolase family 3 N-terminal domain-containing protein [Nocardioides sp.]|nr:glycoside hydrolase family 3 N-terminal domain-containing protein [Nocardioides sp.]